MKYAKTFFVGLSLCAIFALFAVAPAVAQAGTINGFGWSSTLGMVKFTDLTVANKAWNTTIQADGTLSGYAWSPNVGWIRFNPSWTGMPTGSGTTASGVKLVNNKLLGWARACSVFAGMSSNPPTCSGALVGNALRGGWDGWISFSGTGYGISYDPTTGQFGSGSTDLAWGGPITSWLSMRYARTGAANTCSVLAKNASGGEVSSININTPVTWSVDVGGIPVWAFSNESSNVTAQTVTRSYAVAGSVVANATVGTMACIPKTLTVNNFVTCSAAINQNGSITFTAGATYPSYNWVVAGTSGTVGCTSVSGRESSCTTGTNLPVGTYSASLNGVVCATPTISSGTNLAVSFSPDQVRINHPAQYPASSDYVGLRIDSSATISNIDWTKVATGNGLSIQTANNACGGPANGNAMPALYVWRGGAWTPVVLNSTTLNNYDYLNVRFPTRCQVSGLSKYHLGVGVYQVPITFTAGTKTGTATLKVSYNDPDFRP